MEKTSIILYCDNELSYTIECIDSIRLYSEKGTYEIIAVVNSSSTDETINWFIDQTDIIISSCDDDANLQKIWNSAIQISKGNNILFMHSNTVVTENWLTNLLQGLYVSENIAAVGPLSNYHTNDRQMLGADYSSMDELLVFAKQQFLVGVMEGVIEKCLTISDFCFAVKKSALLENGLFDDALESNSFMADFCLRLLNTGYQIALCRNVYIHHYGRLETNEKEAPLFYEKWSFGLQTMKLQEDLINKIENPADHMHVLVLGCGCGTSLRSLLNLYPEAVISGIELDPVQAELASVIGDVTVGPFLEQLNRFEKNSFDHILVTNHFFESANPLKALSMVLNYLRGDGELILELDNPRSYEGFRAFFSDQLMIKYHGSVPTLTELAVFFEKNSLFQSNIVPYEEILNDEARYLFNHTKSLMSPLVQQQFNISKFIIVAKKVPETSSLQAVFNDLFIEYTDEKLERILRYNSSFILNAAETYEGPTVPLLNLLAIESVEQKKYENALLYLNKAYELDPIDSSTLFNLGTVTYVLGDTAKSLEWLIQIPNKNETINQWISKMQMEITLKSEDLRKQKLLLLRVEYNVSQKDALSSLAELIQKQIVRVEDILTIVQEDIVDKRKVLNVFSVYLYKKGIFEPAVALLEKSLEYDPEYEPTVLHLAFSHIQNGDQKEAYRVLEASQMKTPTINEWLHKVKDGLNTI
ncbi:glycosyltransferase [Paenibacillus sp. NPDC057934]|uniref:glycosyltransferase n=1 Tax=Paenibacillus sp. NPDC057934 TaxID=3346282 RepID=UPI0036DDB99F